MLCVNLPINTNYFNNNSIKTITQACNKASKTLKSNLVSKYQNLDFVNLKKFEDLDLTKSKLYSKLLHTNAQNTAPPYSNITNTTPSLVSKFINYDKKEKVHELIETFNINLKKTKLLVEQKVQIMLESLDHPLQPGFVNTTRIIDEFCYVSSTEETFWDNSSDDTIFESSSPTPMKRTKITWVDVYANITTHKITQIKKVKEQIRVELKEFVHVDHEKPIVAYPIWEEPVIAQFLVMAEEKARKQTLNLPNSDNVSYISKFFQIVDKKQSPQKTSIYDTSDFFNTIERKQDSKESKAALKSVAIDYIWFKIYEILTKNSEDKVLELFKLSQLTVKSSKENSQVSLIDTTKKVSGKKEILYDSSYNNHRRIRNSNFH